MLAPRKVTIIPANTPIWKRMYLTRLCARYLVKGRPAAIDGHLEWREWQVDGGGKRQAVEVIADVVQFLGAHRRDEDAAGQAAAVAGETS
jgi:single-stranded DNA-binding protein